MAQLLTWSEVDSNAQSGMSNRCPNETVRLEAINNEVRNLNTAFDIETSLRTKSISIIPDGTAYLISSLVTDDDVKKVSEIYLTADDEGNEYSWQEADEFRRRVRMGYQENSYTTYWEDGKMYLAVNSWGGEAIATAYTMKYFSTFLALNGSNALISEVLADATCKILLPSRFKDLVVAGTKMRLLWPSIGEDGNNQYAIESNKYKSELKKLGLDTVAKAIKKTIRKVKLRTN